MLLKVTAIKYFTILDPTPIEGVGPVTLQQAPGEYKEYDVLPQQGYRLIPLLDDADAAGLLTYDVVYDEAGPTGPTGPTVLRVLRDQPALLGVPLA